MTLVETTRRFLIETRRLIAFREQDLRDKGPEISVYFGKRFESLHIRLVRYYALGFQEVLTTIGQKWRCV